MRNAVLAGLFVLKVCVALIGSPADANCTVTVSTACEEEADCRPEFGDRDCPGCYCDPETYTCRPR